MSRRLLRLAAVAAGVVVILVAIALAVLPFVTRPLAVWQLGKATKRVVTLESATLNVFRGRLAVQGLRVMDHDGVPLATLDRLEARFRPADLLRLRVHVVD